MTDILLSSDWQHALAKYHRLFVGFSGGLDSTVLLHSIANEQALVDKLQAVHVHHGLSEHAMVWQEHCQQFCESLGIPLVVRQVQFDRRANIEEGARDARYAAFSSLLKDDDCLLLAHHSNDQAETLLLQLLRGAGIDGLASMPAVKKLEKGQLARPFLQHAKQRLAAYAAWHQLTWVDDESNRNNDFSRNYLRNEIMPLLQAKWPAVVGNVVRSASHCQQAKINLEALAAMDCLALSERQNTLDIAPLQMLERTRLVNVLRVWLQDNSVRLPSAAILHQLINEVILANVDAQPRIRWGDTIVRRYQHTLYVLTDGDVRAHLSCREWSLFPAKLHLGDDRYLLASPNEVGLRVPGGCRIHVRFRQGGELFYWRGQTKQLKKLWQQWKVPPWQRDDIPLLYIDDQLVSVVGFAISDHYFSRDSTNTYHIELQPGAHS